MSLTPAEEEELIWLLEEEKAERARAGDINAFAEFVIKDSNTTLRIRQAQLHRLIQAHIDWCQAHGVHAGIVAPWGHGKTEQIAIARPIWYLGRDPESRIMLVCNTDPNARKRLIAVRGYIERDPDLRRVFPGLRPRARMGSRSKEKWSDHVLLVERKSRGKDASLEAWGIFSSAMGGRCNILIFDDPVDEKNAILEPSLRPKVVDTVKTWLSRLEHGGFCIYVATCWHKDDATHDLVKNPRFCFLWVAVSDDLTCLEAKVINGLADHPLATLGSAAGAVSPTGQAGGVGRENLRPRVQAAGVHGRRTHFSFI